MDGKCGMHERSAFGDAGVASAVMSDVASLSKAERTRLRTLEAIVDRGVQTFVQVGQALKEIRDSRLYRRTHKRFEDYCDDRWGLGKRYANQLIEASVVVANIAARQPENGSHGSQNPTSPLAATVAEANEHVAPTSIPLPTTERQARELAKLPAEEQADVWEEVVATEARPTAAAIKGVVERRKSAKAEAKPEATANPPRDKVYRADADLPESYIDEDGNAVPESLWPVWQDMPQFMRIADGIRSSGVMELSKELRELGVKHNSQVAQDAAAEILELHGRMVKLSLDCKPAIVTGSDWITKGEAPF